LVVFILHLASSEKGLGVDSKSGQFFKNMNRYGLWPDAHPVHRTSVSKARQKISWEFFKDLMVNAVQLAYDNIPTTDNHLWHGKSVFAIDGSQYILPASPHIRETFDPSSGLETNGRGHFPQCLVSTLYDVFRRLPVARTVVDSQGSERDEAANLLKHLPTKNNLILFDRGYPSFELIHMLSSETPSRFVFRCPAKSSFKAIDEFLIKDKQQGYIHISPTGRFLSKVPPGNRKEIKAIKLRIIKMVSPSDGTVSVLITNLYNESKYSYQDITDLYFKRWEVEVYYRDEKTVLNATKFHTRTVNGVLQEMYAIPVMSLIARTLMHLSLEKNLENKQMPQFKNSIIALSSELGLFVSNEIERAISIFKELLQEMLRVPYPKTAKKRPSTRRVNKSPNNKWKDNKRQKSK